MSPVRLQGRALVAAGAGAALVLGILTTVILAVTGAFRPIAPAVVSRASCTVPALPGRVVDVALADMGPGMMHRPDGRGPRNGGGYGGYGAGMMRVITRPATVPAGTVSLRVVNTGVLTHELVVLPLPAGQAAGQRPAGSDGRVGEAGSLGEASRSCGPGSGDGIAPGSVGWTTLRLLPGRYELICNLPGHYTAGMSTELDVTAR